MKNTLKIDHFHGIITMDRTFAKKAENTMSAEYAHLQNVRRDYPEYKVIRRQIKKNPNKEHWRGLTYKYMEDYISSHEEGENKIAVLKEFHEKRLISECHSSTHRYPVIKKWFLAKYPEIAEFGCDPVSESEENAENNVVNIPQSNEEKESA